MRSHDENRSVLCGLCFRKRDLRNITDTQLGQLRALVDYNYSLDNIKYQRVLCKVCAMDLTAHDKNPTSPGRKLLKPSYTNLKFPPVYGTRAAEDAACPCTVCEMASCTLTPGAFQQAIPHIQEKYWMLLFPDLPYPGAKLSSKPTPPVEHRCSLCHAVVGKGRSHKCTKTGMQDNLHKIVKDKSLKSKEKIGGKVLKNIFDEKVVSARGGTVLLSTGGRKLPVTLSLKLNKPRFTHSNLRRLQVIKGDSDRGIKKFAQAIRHTFGRQSVEPGFAEILTQRNKQLGHLFEVKTFEMKKKPAKKKNNDGDIETGDPNDDNILDDDGYFTYTVPGVVAPDLDALIKEVVEARDLDPGDVQVICGLDNGQKFNKIAFLVKQKQTSLEEKGRQRRSMELFRDKFKDSGVKMLILAAVIPSCPENHHNQKEMLNALGIEGLEWGTTVDLKMALCLTGKSGGQLTYGCPFCDMAKPYKETEYNLLTLADLVELHAGYVAAGSNKKEQAKFQNCVNDNLLAGDPDTKVLNILIPPELHLLIGVVDKHLKGLEEVFGLTWVDAYLKAVNIVRKCYQGSHALEGNQSSMFLKKLPILEQAIMKESDDLKVSGLALLESLRSFQKVQETCFGQFLKEGYESSISEFSRVYKALDMEKMTITPKIHIIEHHLVDFFNEVGGTEQHGLGWYSEQGFEAMHYDMMQEWKRVQICDPGHPDFGKKLLDFIVAYNARHI